MIVYLEQDEIKRVLREYVEKKLQYSITIPVSEDCFFKVEVEGKEIIHDEVLFGFVTGE